MAKNPLEQFKKQQQAIPAVKPNPYQTLYGLRENAFPLLPLFTPSIDDPRRDGRIYDERFREEQEHQFFDMFVQRPHAGEDPLSLGFLRLQLAGGARGNGKSVFLHRIMERINEQDWHDWPSDAESPELFALAVHVLPEPRKHRTFQDVIHLIFTTLRERGLLARVDELVRAAGLLALLSPSDFQKLQDLSGEEMSNAIGSVENFESLLQDHKLTITGFAEEIGRQLDAVSPGFLASKFGRSYLNVGCSLVHTWERLQSSSSYALQASAADWLVNGLMPILMVAGYRRFFLLLDEFERIYRSQTARKRDEFLESLRHHFFERDATAVARRFITVLLTLHPSVDQYLKDPWQRAGLDRFAPVTLPQVKNFSVELGAATASQLGRMIAVYLNWFRMTPAQNDTIRPFADGSLEPVFEAARFFPGFTLRHARTVLAQAADQGIPAPISRTFVEAVLKTTPPPPHDDDDDDDDDGLGRSETQLSG